MLNFCSELLSNCAYVETGELTLFKLVNHVWLLIKQSTTALLKFNKSKFTQWHRSNCYGLKIYPSPQEKILPHFENVISNAKELGCVTMGGDEVTRMKWNDRCRYLRPVSIIKGRAEGPFVSLFMLFPPFYFLSQGGKGSRHQPGLPGLQDYEPAQVCSQYSISGIMKESYK